MRTVNSVTIAPEFAIWSYVNASAVTPSNTVGLTDATHAIYVGGAGDLTVIMAEDQTQTPVTFKAVPVGTVLALAVNFVMATGTTATNIVALY